MDVPDIIDATTGRRIFIYLTNGEMSVDGQKMEPKGQARIDTENPLFMKASTNAEFLLIDVPSFKGWGYSQETLHGGKI